MNMPIVQPDRNRELVTTEGYLLDLHNEIKEERRRRVELEKDIRSLQNSLEASNIAIVKLTELLRNMLWASNAGAHDAIEQYREQAKELLK